MKTTIKEITPQYAAQVLESRNPNNRKISERFVDRLVREIKSNGWILTHQGIAFDENGDLIDGQHRLEAIRRANRPVTMVVTTGLPATQRANGIMLKTFECIDNGRARGVGQMIAMNGWANGNAVAAVVRAMANWVTSPANWLALTTPQTEKILAKCGSSVEWVVRNSNSSSMVKVQGGARAAIAYLHTVEPKQAEDFLGKVTGLEGLKKTHPAYALATWLKNHPSCNGSTQVSRVASSAIWHFSHGNNVEKIYSNDEASDWLIGKNKQLAAYIGSIINL